MAKQVLRPESGVRLIRQPNSTQESVQPVEESPRIVDAHMPS